VLLDKRRRAASRPPPRAPSAASGVDLISAGWLTHSASVLDIGLDWQRLGRVDRARSIGQPAERTLSPAFPGGR